MRMYGYLKQPYKMDETDPESDAIYKVMIHKDENDVDAVYVYLYTSIDAIFCSNDDYYTNVTAALKDWDSEIDERGWIQIDDPLPYCQDDSILPIRVKGRNTGNPQWGQLEILVDDEWVEYNMNL